MTHNSDFVQMVVAPHTGIQICRGLPLPEQFRKAAADIWKYTLRQAERVRGNNPALGLIAEHIACPQEDTARGLQSTGWVPCGASESAFFRLTRTGKDVHLDLVIDTQCDPGNRVGNKIDCLVQGGAFWNRRRFHLAGFFVIDPQTPRNVSGSLFVDFGNTASCFIFSELGKSPLDVQPLSVRVPFDPHHGRRSEDRRRILRSGMTALRVPPTDQTAPWLVVGDYAEELVQRHPHATHVHAPKKYLRRWPDHLKAQEPTTLFRGVVGQRIGMVPLLQLVEYTFDKLFESVLTSLTNPNQVSRTPDFVPQFHQVLLTYPLTWREVDRSLYREMVERVAQSRLGGHERMVVDLVCSEPVAVAAYVLWKTFFHFGNDSLSLAAGFLGNTSGAPQNRLLIVDIGGGSTDIALLRASWNVTRGPDKGEILDVYLEQLEAMRFNRAGDRLSHFIAAALLEFLREKYGVTESLDFGTMASRSAFTLQHKRRLVMEISRLAEQAKVALSGTKPAANNLASQDSPMWSLAPGDEVVLVSCLQSLLKEPDAARTKTQKGPRFRLSPQTLREWVLQDLQSMETGNEPGFMDIFAYMRELRESLAATDSLPQLVVLSGRTTRLPFLKELVVQHLGLPMHRVRTLGELWPNSLKSRGHEDMDKLAVVCGAHCFRFGDPIRFRQVQERPIFKRFLGVIRATPEGLRLNRIVARPGDSHMRTETLLVEPLHSLRIGRALRPDGSAEILAVLTNRSSIQQHEAALKLVNDHTVLLDSGKENADIVLEEWVSGSAEAIADNFNDTGRIDGEPEGFLRKIVLSNHHKWFAQESRSS